MSFKGGAGDCPVDGSDKVIVQRGKVGEGPVEPASVRMLISLATGKGNSAGVTISKREGVWRSEEVEDSRVGSLIEGVSTVEEGRRAGDSVLGV